MLTRPGVWIWMMAVMVLTGTAITAALLLMPDGQDLTLVRLALIFVASALVAVPISRGISTAMTAPVP